LTNDALGDAVGKLYVQRYVVIEEVRIVRRNNRKSQIANLKSL